MHSIMNAHSWHRCRHLRDLMLDEARCMNLIKESEGIYFDFSRQRVTPKTLELLLKLAETANLKQRIEAMFDGQHINVTEDRAVLHTATRARRDQVGSRACIWAVVNGIFGGACWSAPAIVGWLLVGRLCLLSEQIG